MKSTYNYFAQFKEIEIDFKDYDFEKEFTTKKDTKITLRNLFERYDIVDEIQNQSYFFEYINVDDSERPDTLAQRKYNDENLWWIILIFNQTNHPFLEWSLDTNFEYAYKTYLTNTENKYNTETYTNLLIESTNEQRKIKLLRSEFVQDVLSLFYERVVLGRPTTEEENSEERIIL